jgi:hypothetical protein
MPSFHMRHIKTIFGVRVLITCEMARIGVKVHIRKHSRFWAGITAENYNPFTSQDYRFKFRQVSCCSSLRDTVPFPFLSTSATGFHL